MDKEFIKKIETQGKENARHLAVLNDEMGELRDTQKETRRDISGVKDILTNHKISLTRLEGDMEWLKKFFWILASGVMATLIASLMNLILQ